MQTPEPLNVALLAVPESTPTVLYGLMEVLSTAGSGWGGLAPGAPDARRIRPRFVSRPGGTFVNAQGVPFPATVALAEVPAVDVAIVTDLDLLAVPDPRGRWPAEAAWLRQQHSAGATLCSVCTGTVLLADAGLLDGEEATSHWGAAPVFAECYPRVRLRPERLLCAAGPEHRIVTSGGSGAWADLALYLIARFCGAAEATRISKIFVLGDHSDGQLPFAMMNRARAHGDAAVARCQAWASEHYAETNPVARMVAHSGLPERTFKRRFRAATGFAPLDYVQILRVEEAKQMLEATDDPVDSVAVSVGYQDPASFRRVFKRRTGVTPARYRQRFRTLLRAPADAAGHCGSSTGE